MDEVRLAVHHSEIVQCFIQEGKWHLGMPVWELCSLLRLLLRSFNVKRLMKSWKHTKHTAQHEGSFGIKQCWRHGKAYGTKSTCKTTCKGKPRRWWSAHFGFWSWFYSGNCLSSRKDLPAVNLSPPPYQDVLFREVSVELLLWWDVRQAC